MIPSPDGQFVLTGSRDFTIKLWEAATAKEIHTFRGHDGEITALAFSPDGQYFLSGSRDQTIRLWSIPHRKEIYQSKKFNALSTLTFSPDGQTILITNENIAQVWAFNHQQPFDDFPPIQTFREHQNEIEHAAFSPDGQLLITSSKKKLVKIWKLGQATAIRTFQATNPILAIGFTDKDNQLLICSNKAVQRLSLIHI